MEIKIATLDPTYIDHIAEQVKEAFAVKLRMKQG